MPSDRQPPAPAYSMESRCALPPCFLGSVSVSTPLNTAFLRERGIAATRQLAKRQITWLRSMPQRHTIACDQPHAVAALVQAVLQRLAQRTP